MGLEWLKAQKDIPAAVLREADKVMEGEEKYFRYLQMFGDKLVIRVFACKYYKRRRRFLTEIERITPGEEFGVQKNVVFTQMGGYRPVYEPKDKKSSSWYGYTYYLFEKEDFDKWHTEKCMPEYKGDIINLDFLFTIDKYKYCGYSGKQGLKDYLTYYEKDPKVELFGKAGIRYQPNLAKAMEKDPQFRKFVLKNSKELDKYTVSVIQYAYKQKMGFGEAEEFLQKKRTAEMVYFRGTAKVKYKVDKAKIHDWFDNLPYTDGMINRSYKSGCWKNGYQRTIGWRSYLDYWNACVGLGLDMRDSKNSMPRDFMRMHDLRINEYASKKAQIEEEARIRIDEKIKEVSERYGFNFKDDKYMVVIPESKQDLEKEGRALHHCVGTMGYDVKIAGQQSLIAFVRNVNEPDVSFVTVEYDVKQKKVLQVSGNHNKSPESDVYKFVNSWARQIGGMKNGKKAI